MIGFFFDTRAFESAMANLKKAFYNAGRSLGKFARGLMFLRAAELKYRRGARALARSRRNTPKIRKHGRSQPSRRR